MRAFLNAIDYHFPDQRRDNKELVALNANWDEAAILRKTGIRSRPIAGPTETASDLAFQAATKLLDRTGFPRGRIDVLLFCTESPDYPLPPSACLLQSRLNLPRTCGAFDYNLGCSGFTYGLWLARALILSGSAQSILLLCADTYTKYCNPHDIVTATIFADAAGAALITASPDLALAEIGSSIVGTDGRGAENIIVRAGGARHPRSSRSEMPPAKLDENARDSAHLFMNGPEIYGFTLATLKPEIERLLAQVEIAWGNVDRFFVHQANRYMLESLRSLMGLTAEQMPVDMECVGNTVSASLPILLARSDERGDIPAGAKCVLAGFGVGYSWAMTYLKWRS